MPFSTNAPGSYAVNQNSLNLITPKTSEGSTLGRGGGVAPATRADAQSEQLQLSGVKQQQVNTASSFLKELQGAQSIFQAANSAFQEIEQRVLEGAEDEQLRKAGDKALDLLQNIANVRAQQELKDIKSKLASSDNASFADVVEAVAVLARVAKGGLDKADTGTLQELAEAISVVNEALSKAQTRLENLTNTVSTASNKATEDLNNRKGMEKMMAALGQAMQGSRENAIKAQANINSAVVARMLGEDI
ncbi:hypothetical protein [Limnobacter sp.]|uniref:hypothetical protein n=1 Tax=Limnobacter sp. TaxID=2003368 RepID=UPI003519661F